MEMTLLTGRLTQDGAGVKLTRIFANESTRQTDPFLLLDHFGSDHPADYIKGFPWHPHRGIETVTYMLGGEVKHRDSLGNSGVIRAGDLQWMTAGSGIIHEEMPQPGEGKMHGLQLWVNLPARHKMIPPRYRGILAADVPVFRSPDTEIRVIAGIEDGVKGPVKDLTVAVDYLDVQLKNRATYTHQAKAGYSTFCYALAGRGEINDTTITAGQLLLFHGQGPLLARSGASLRYIYVSGRQLREPIAWGGPIVMNTQQELDQAFRELDEGTFIR